MLQRALLFLLCLKNLAKIEQPRSVLNGHESRSLTVGIARILHVNSKKAIQTLLGVGVLALPESLGIT